MLTDLTIQNYAIIKKLSIDFSRGFSVVTGETGAGKSIILGAMHMMLGQRADTQVMFDKDKKCIVEGTFSVSNYKLESLFEENDIDFETECIIRREIAPSGKSRAFINDTPVTLGTLKTISSELIDIHSQLKNAQLEQTDFQRNVIDYVSGALPALDRYKNTFKKFKTAQTELKKLRIKKEAHSNESDFLKFQYDELATANLSVEEETVLEGEQQMLSNAESIQDGLSYIQQLLSNDENGIISVLNDAARKASTICGVLSKAEALQQQLESCSIELDDIGIEVDRLNSEVEHNPARLETVNERLSQIFQLKLKHKVDSVADLIAIQDKLESQLEETFFIDDKIESCQKQIAELKETLSKLALALSKKRAVGFPKIKKYIDTNIALLGMPNAQININVKISEEFLPWGNEELQFTFAANKNSEFSPIGEVASGGEKSRLMLVMKSLLATQKSLPTIIFDEIDTGVSGDVAQKLGLLMRNLGENMQVFSITHLPQVASQGVRHYKVVKTDLKDRAETTILELDKDERILELAELLSGKNPSNAAISNAKELLGV